MSNFIKFKTDKFWTYETSPYIDILYQDAIPLCPKENYLQCLDKDVFDLLDNENPVFKIIDCKGNEIDSNFVFKIIEGKLYFEFFILEDNYCELLRVVIDDKFYSNTFTCSEENKCFTSLIHYKDSLSDCFCEEPDAYYRNIRLKVAFKDCEDADEFESYREFTTGKTRSSRVKQNTFSIYTIEADKLVNDCFKEAFNSSEFYIDKCRHSKVEPFSRGARLGNSNCSNTEFKTSKIEDEVLEFNNQIICSFITNTINVNYDSSSADVNDCLYTFNFAELVNGNTLTNPIESITIKTLTGQGELALSNTLLEVPTTLTEIDIDNGVFQFWAKDIDLLGVFGNFTTEFILCITDDEGSAIDEVTMVINATDTSVIISQLQITIGKCSTDLTGANWINIYTNSILTNGSIIYTDTALTIPFNGGGIGSFYRIQVSIGLLYNNQYTVNNLGEIIGVLPC